MQLEEILFPAIEPYHSEHLNVDGYHHIYIEQCGNPEGEPILFVHGGPGGGCSARNRQYFDPAHYHIILVDQRGCGRSRPVGDITHNTTQHLIADFEQIRQHLNIDTWCLFGGSWGSTLSLAYAQAHPEVIRCMILRGIFQGTQREIDWILDPDGLHRFYPELVEPFYALLSNSEQKEVLTAYYQRLCSDDRDTVMAAANALCHVELGVSSLDNDSQQVLEDVLDTQTAINIALIECHYFVNHCFLERPLLEDIKQIKHIPAAIVHGRYDMVCPFESAWKLHQAWPEASFYPIRTAGHSASDVALAQQLVRLTDQWKTEQRL